MNYPVRQNARWPKRSRRYIEELIDRSLPPLPGGGELYHQVLAQGGGQTEEIIRTVFQPYPLMELPPPHNLFRCGVYGDFRSGQPKRSRRAELGEAFWKQLTPQAASGCWYHETDWRVVAEASVTILAELGPAFAEDYIARAQQERFAQAELAGLISLFEDPIYVTEEGYSNGQHRGCALRFSGATHAAIAVDDEVVGGQNVDWEYLGDG